MSIEQKIIDLAIQMQKLTEVIVNLQGVMGTLVAQVQTVPVVQPVTQPVQAMPSIFQAPVAPVVTQQPVAQPVQAMPAMPTFQTVAPPAPIGVPFNDAKGLLDYVMTAYKTMGPQKGAMIQNVLTQLGYQNISDVKPEHYGHLFAGVEQLKAAP